MSIKKSLSVSESHFIQDYNPILPLERLPPISTCPSNSNSQYISRSTNSPTSQSPTTSFSSSPFTNLEDQNYNFDDQRHNCDDSGSDYYTSNSDSDSQLSQSEISPKRLAKKQRLKNERDKIKPSFYYGEKELEEEAIQKGINPPKRKRKGCRGVPVFEPSMEQFQDFYSYINQIDRWGMRSGIVKIIPPKEWSDQLPHLGQESLRTDGMGQMLRNAKIKSPISQVIQGSRGLYRVMNVTKRRGYNALEWYDLANSAEHRPPDFSNKTIDQSSHSNLNNLDTFSNTRTTRSSRRSASNIAPISQKAQNGRRSRVSKVHSTADNSTTTLSSPIKQDQQQHALSSRPNSPAQLQGCKNSKVDCLSPPMPAPLAHPDSDQHPSIQPPQCDIDLNKESSSDIKNDMPTDAPPPQELIKSRANTPEALTLNVSSKQSEKISIASHDTPQTGSKIVENVGPGQSNNKKSTRAPPSGPTPEEWATFVERYDKLPYGTSKSDYTFQVCREIEQEYWRTIGNGGEPMYGADTMGSLFDDRTKDWNVANLDNLLNRLKLKKKIPGVNTPYLYFGSWRATFAWHVEDADLYSINYIHFGAPKFWYSIPQEHNQRFENFMSSSFAKERRTCAQFLRHKAFLASPSVLHSVGVQLNKVVHLPGEIILTYPYGYHSGFNLGYNCAESVNFANESWIEKGKKAQFCKCIDDAVTINVEAWLQEHAELCRKEEELRSRAAQKLRRQQQLELRKRQKAEPPDGQATPPKKRKKKQENSDDVDRHPENHEVDTKETTLADPSYLNDSNPQTTVHTPAPKPTRKPRTKKIAQSAGDGRTSDTKEQKKSDKALKKKSTVTDSVIQGASSTQRIPKKQKLGSQQKKFFPCALCPDPSEEGLLRIVEETISIPNNLVQQAPCLDSSLPAAEGDPSSDLTKCEAHLSPELVKPAQPQPQPQMRPKPIKRAHKVCCMFTPSTWFELLPTGEEVVKGFEAIEKARWGLKCQLCKEKMGTKVQCTKSGKCAKACHVTCGLKTGIFLLDARFVKGDLSYSLLDPLPEGLPPGLDVGQDPELVVLCKQHNPHYQRAEAERKSKELANKVAQFTPNQIIKVKISKGIFQVFFHSRNEFLKTVKVTYEDGHSDILPYSRIYFGSVDPNNPQKNPDSNVNVSNQTNVQDAMNGVTPTQPSASINPSIEHLIDPMMEMIDNSPSLFTQKDQVTTTTSSLDLNNNPTISNNANNYFLQNHEPVVNMNPNFDDRRLLLLADLSTVGHSNQIFVHPNHLSSTPPPTATITFNTTSQLNDQASSILDHHNQNNYINNSNDNPHLLLNHLNHSSIGFDDSAPNHHRLSTLSAIQKGLIDSRLL